MSEITYDYNVFREEPYEGLIDIALIDTGAKYDGINVVERKTFCDDLPIDDNGHGTRMVEYIRSFNQNATIISLKVAGFRGIAKPQHIADAIYYAVQKNVKVINISLSAIASDENIIVKHAVEHAIANGIIVVASAGNSNDNYLNYTPGNIPGVISVTSCNAGGFNDSYANYGEGITIAARATSTSAAAAIVSSIIAENSEINNTNVVQFLERCAIENISELHFNNKIEANQDSAIKLAEKYAEYYTIDAEATYVNFSCGASTTITSTVSGIKCPTHNVSCGTATYTPGGYVYLTCAGSSGTSGGGTGSSYTVSFTYNGGEYGSTPSQWRDRNNNTVSTAPSSGVLTLAGKYNYGTYGLVAPKKEVRVNSFTVSYNGNSGTVGSTDASNTLSKKTAVYTFLYWHSDADSCNYGPSSGSSGRDLYPTTTVGRHYIVDRSVDFAANWSSSPASYKNLGAVTLPSASRSLYTFAGWYTAASGGTYVGGSGGSYTPSANTTLYAHYTANKYTVTYDANGGTGAPSPTTITVDAGTKLSTTVPTRTGYTFVGWRQGTVTLQPGQAWPNSWGGATIKAIWIGNKVKVTLGGNGGTVGTSAFYFRYNTNTYYSDSDLTTVITKIPSNATRSGYALTGYWSASSGGTQYVDSSGNIVNNLYSKYYSDVTLYAQWVSNSRNLYIWPHSGQYEGNDATKITFSQAVGTTKTISYPTLANATFSGWGTDPYMSGAKLYDCYFDLANPFSVYDNAGSGKISLTWETSSSNPFGGYGSSSISRSIKIARTAGSGTFPGMGGFYCTQYSSANQIYRVSIVAYIPKNYYLEEGHNSIGTGGYITWLTPRQGVGDWSWYVYDVHCGTTTGSSFGYQYTLPISGTGTAATDAINWWVGWYQIQNITSSSGNTHTFTADASAEAAYFYNNYLVTFDKKGGTGGSDSIHVRYEPTVSSTANQRNFCFTYTSPFVTTLTPPTKTGYTFQGYYTTDAATGGTRYVNAAGAFVNNLYSVITSAMTLYARWWEQIPVPTQNGTVKYDGTVKSVTDTSAWNNFDTSKLTIGGTTSATVIGTYTATFTPKSGYTFPDGTTEAKSVTWTIGKGDPVIGINMLTPRYTGSPKRIAEVTNQSTGITYTLGYSLTDTGTVTWGTAGQPLNATDQGTYYIWYKITGGTNYNDVAATLHGPTYIRDALYKTKPIYQWNSTTNKWEPRWPYIYENGEWKKVDLCVYANDTWKQSDKIKPD